MPDTVLPAIVYDHAPTALLFADDRARLEGARVTAVSVGLRVVAASSIGDAFQRIERQASTDVVMIELSGDHGPAQDALLDLIDTLAADGVAVVIVLPATLIDAVSARISNGAVQLLCDPTPSQRAGALGMAAVARGFAVQEKDAQADSERLLRLSEEVGRIARTLAEMAEREPAASIASAHDRTTGYRAEAPAPIAPADLRRMIRIRRLRDQYFDGALFADPAWDMLLDLMAARIERQRVAVSSLCIAAAVPATTALRWIAAMTEQGLFVRQADPHDARRVFIGLSDDAAAAMAAFLDASRKLGGGPV